MDTTFDGLLNRRVQLEQPAQGFRVAVDTVLLAAAVNAKEGQKILDLGAGVGGTMLCLACRAPGVSIIGVEIQPELAELCMQNIELNAFDADLKIIEGDATQLPDSFIDTFDHVMINPPYHDEPRHDVSSGTIKRTANTEKDGDLEKWISSAKKSLKAHGVMTMIHRADRLDEILSIVSKLFGEMTIFPLLPKEAAAPKRLIVQAVKGEQSSITQCKGLVLHKPEGGYTDEAEAILRHMKSIDFVE